MNMSSLSRLLPTGVVVGLVGGLVLTLVFVAITMEGSAIPEKPHNVPVAVVGSSAATSRLAAGLERGGAFQVTSVPTEAAAVDLVRHRKADAVVNLNTHQLQTASADGIQTPPVLQQALASQHLQSADIAPLKSGDPTGIGLMFLALAAVITGLPSGVALALMGRRRRPTSLADAGGQSLLIVGYAGLAGLGVAALTAATLGYTGTQFLIVWAWESLLIAASMATAVALVAAFGIAGVVLAALPLLFFGPPSAPIPSPWNWQTSGIRHLGPFAPFGSMVNGLRNELFFPAAAQTQNLLVLFGWLVVPILLLAAIGWRGRRAEVVEVAPIRKMAAAA